jgi:hypothetical protein
MNKGEKGVRSGHPLRRKLCDYFVVPRPRRRGKVKRSRASEVRFIEQTGGAGLRAQLQGGEPLASQRAQLALQNGDAWQLNLTRAPSRRTRSRSLSLSKVPWPGASAADRSASPARTEKPALVVWGRRCARLVLPEKSVTIQRNAIIQPVANEPRNKPSNGSKWPREGEASGNAEGRSGLRIGAPAFNQHH